MDPVVIPLSFRHVFDIYWSSSGCSDNFLSYNFATGTVQGY